LGAKRRGGEGGDPPPPPPPPPPPLPRKPLRVRDERAERSRHEESKNPVETSEPDTR
jgi:hypothetical protein